MTNDKQSRPYVRLATSAVVAGGLALTGLGLAAGVAQAAPPAPAPMYHHHWCPGDQWDPGWGPYGNWNACRDWDDAVGPAAWQGGPPQWQGGPPPWAAQAPPPPFWAPWAQVTWNADANGWGFWNSGVWVPL